MRTCNFPSAPYTVMPDLERPPLPDVTGEKCILAFFLWRLIRRGRPTSRGKNRDAINTCLPYDETRRVNCNVERYDRLETEVAYGRIERGMLQEVFRPGQLGGSDEVIRLAAAG